MFIADKWQDYQVLYAGDGEKYESWGDIILRRPDPQAVWPVHVDGSVSSMDNLPKPHAIYNRSTTGGGSWSKLKPMPDKWKISYNSDKLNLKFIIEPTSFKHTGLFPEQAANWDFCAGLISDAKKQGREEIRILNLFAYTGAATLACAAGGADEVVHVDSSKGMIQRAKENVIESGLQDSYIRFIAEDCRRFVEREIRRGRKYDGIIMDPPKYGRGPTGELWEIEKSLFEFVDRCSLLLSDDPLFLLISSYATDVAPHAVGNIIDLTVGKKFGGHVESQELLLPISKMGIELPCGATSRWTR